MLRTVAGLLCGPPYKATLCITLHSSSVSCQPLTCKRKTIPCSDLEERLHSSFEVGHGHRGRKGWASYWATITCCILVGLVASYIQCGFLLLQHLRLIEAQILEHIAWQNVTILFLLVLPIECELLCAVLCAVIVLILTITRDG